MDELETSAPGNLRRLLRSARERAADRLRNFVWDPYGRSPPPVSRPSSTRPLKVLLSDQGSTLFQFTDDPRLTITTQQAGAPLKEAPDLFVLTRAELFQFERRAADLPSEIWGLLAQGRTRLVLDASREGTPFGKPLVGAIRGFLHSHGLKPSMAAWITQHRGFAQDYDDDCDANGVGVDRMRVLIHDQFIQQTFGGLRGDHRKLFRRRLDQFAARPRSRPKRFLSLNRTIRVGKALYLAGLMDAGLWDCGYISLGSLDHIEGGRDKLLRQMRAHKDLDDLEPQVDRLLEYMKRTGPVEFVPPDDGSGKLRTKLFVRPTRLGEYDRSWFSVVTESSTGDRLIRITEKSFKPMLNFHPFLTVGPLQCLRLVRAYGFDTYPGMFDESYDETRGVRARIDRALAETQRLCRIGEAEMAALEAEAAGTVIFNAWWALMVLPYLFATHIDASLIDQLAHFCDTPQRAEAGAR